MAEMWYYTSEGKQMDPVSIKELKRLVKDGVLKPTDMVWKDGMPRWIRASSVQELYPDPLAKLDQYFSSPKDDKRPGGPASPPGMAAAAASSSSVQAKTAGAATAPAGADEEETRPRVNKRRPPADDDDERGSRNKSKGGGSKVGIVLALVFGGGLLLAGLVVGIVILVMVTRAPNVPPAARPQLKTLPNEFTKEFTKFEMDLGPNTNKSRNITLRRGVEYQITVTSEPRRADDAFRPDIDLHVFNRNGQLVEEDTTPGPNSTVAFLAQDEGDYRIELRNLDGEIKVKSVVTVWEPGPVIVAKKDDPKDLPLPPDVKIGSALISGINLAPGQPHEFKVRVKKGVEASFSVNTLTIKGQPKQPAMNHLLIVKENNETILASDTVPLLKAQAKFMPEVTEIARVRVVNTSKTVPARVSVSYNVGP